MKTKQITFWLPTVKDIWNLLFYRYDKQLMREFETLVRRGVWGNKENLDKMGKLKFRCVLLRFARRGLGIYAEYREEFISKYNLRGDK